MTETPMQGALLEDLTFDVVVQFTKKGDILFSSIEKYMHDAEHQAQADKNGTRKMGRVKTPEDAAGRARNVREAKENKLK